MTENVGKAQFINFLLEEKHGIPPKGSPIVESQIECLQAPPVLKNFDADFSEDSLKTWLRKIQGEVPYEKDAANDLLFGMLYSSEAFVKLTRKKDPEFASVFAFYKDLFQRNRKYLMDFHKRSEGRLSINAPEKIVTRFPPEPSGYLHIGHAKAALLNHQMAKDGTMLVRFDDTNPEKESEEFQNAILEDLKLLNITEYKLSHSSDHFDLLYEYAQKLIGLGKAYADNTPRETMQYERTNGIASKNREMPPEESLRIFKGMREGECREYCLRAKISVDDLNKAMRDPVIYRASDVLHPVTKDKYKIYPTYDFTAPILDSIEGVTLTMRTNEYRDRNPQYYWFLDALSLENRPKIHDFSRLCLENTVISKRKMKFYVENGYVSGWDDPRMCTLRGLKRRGMCMDALIEYVNLQGATQKTSINSWDKVWAINRKHIDPISMRCSAVPLLNSVVCRVDGAECRDVNAPKHKKNPGLGTKRIHYRDEIVLSQEDANALKEGEEFTLMSWGNAVVERKAMDGVLVKSLALRLNLAGDYKKTTHKISWVTRVGSVQIKCYEYEDMLKKTDSEDPHEQFNENSKKEEWWLGEGCCTDLMPGEFMQIERVGFFVCDGFGEFNLVPFTKQARSY